MEKGTSVGTVAYTRWLQLCGGSSYYLLEDLISEKLDQILMILTILRVLAILSPREGLSHLREDYGLKLNIHFACLRSEFLEKCAKSDSKIELLIGLSLASLVSF